MGTLCNLLPEHVLYLVLMEMPQIWIKHFIRTQISFFYYCHSFVSDAWIKCYVRLFIKNSQRRGTETDIFTAPLWSWKKYLTYSSFDKRFWLTAACIQTRVQIKYLLNHTLGSNMHNEVNNSTNTHNSEIPFPIDREQNVSLVLLYSSIMDNI